MLGALPPAAANSRYHCLNVGDVIVEHNTVMSGITGHAGIVEGKFYSPDRGMYYIRMIEAISDGVCRSVIDDDRVDYKESYFYRLSTTSVHAATYAEYAVEFCINQIGKPYSLHLGAHTEYNSTSWYCSELVWAAYMSQGQNIVPGQTTTAMVTPYSFESSSALYEISIT